MQDSVRAARTGKRRAATFWSAVWLASLIMGFTSVVADAITLNAAQSRKVHGMAGPVDIRIDLAQGIGDAVTVESRAIGAGHQIVFQFDQPVTSHGTPVAFDEASAPVGALTAAIAGNEVIVTLANVPDNKRVRVVLPNVNGAGDVEVSMGFLVGDVDNSRSVTATDVQQIKARSGQVVVAGNARSDLNATGVISAADIAAVKYRSPRTLPAVTVPTTYSLVISRSGTGAGTVTSSPAGINCGVDCNKAYSANATVSLTATASADSTFAGWSGACSGTGTCGVTMNAAKAVTANFTLDGAVPPNPATVAPILDPTITTNIATATSFLYTGPNPIQTGVVAGTIQPGRVAVLRGKVQARDGTPLPGVKVSVLDHAEFGQTLTRTDGAFDLAVNGGGQLMLRYERNGLLPVQRALLAPWRDYAWLPDVVMIPFDTTVTTVDLANPTMQIARGTPASDADGVRQATILFPPGTTAMLVMPNGSTQPLTTLNVRATEFTIGDSGPNAMPAPLPPGSGYTYALELSVDEAIGAGATEVRFSQPLPTYVENFLGFPVGGAVPAGYYDRQKGQWIASANGRVIKVLGIGGGVASLDIDGSGNAANAAALNALGVTAAELARLAQLYAVGQTLWRVPVTHFTPWDYNWPYGPPLDAIRPREVRRIYPPDDPHEECGSVIGCEDQTLGESLPVTGAPWRLHYRSKRTPGHKESSSISIQVSGATVPASLRKMRVEVLIAGRKYEAAFAAAPNVAFNVPWDGKDAYGRELSGAQDATVRVHYDYQLQYYASRIDVENSFARAESRGIDLVSASRASALITFTSAWIEKLGSNDARAFGLGGWSLGVQHSYNPVSHTLLLGNGQQRTGAALPSILITVIGGLNRLGFNGDGSPADATQIRNPTDVAADPDGSLFFSDFNNHRVRRVGPDGMVTTLAGTGPGFSGDGGLATAAQLNRPTGIAVGADRSLFIADRDNNRIRLVGPDGIITTFAGNGVPGFGGDGGPAAAAMLSAGSHYIAASPDGSVYISDAGNFRVRRVGTDGIITTVAGNGSIGFSGDGGLAITAKLNNPRGVAIGPDGSLYIADSNNRRIRRVAPDGIITTFAGDGGPFSGGDGGPAELAQLGSAEVVAVGPDGSVYIPDDYDCHIRRVGLDGVITRVAGYICGQIAGDGGAATGPDVRMTSATGVTVGAKGNLFAAYFNDNRIRVVKPVLPEFAVSDVLLAADDGRELYVFNSNGRHLKTLDALTGAVRYQFAYSTLGYLTSVTGVSGNITAIERTGAVPTAIVAPGGQRTELTVNAGGWLLSATNPAAQAHTMTYSVDGLLQQLTDPRGNTHTYTYDASGRLTKDEDPAGGSTTLARTEQAGGYTVTTTTVLGLTRSYQVEHLPNRVVRRTLTAQTGAQTVTLIAPDGGVTVTSPDGEKVVSAFGPDPRFGLLAPVLANRVRTVPGGPTETTTGTRTASLTDPNNLLSLQSLTDTVTVNGRTFSRSYDAATRTMTSTSAEGRQTVSVLDAQGRMVSRTPAPGVAPITLTYDGQGRVSEMRQGAQAWTYGYDARNRVISRTDAAGRLVRYVHDNADRITQKTLPGGEIYQFTYDANGNRTAVIMPGGSSHALGYSTINRDTSYTPPGNASYLRTFNVDRQLTRTTLPAGRFTEQGYDTLGRVNGLSYAEGVTTFGYLAADMTDRVASITNTPVSGPAQDIAFGYTGSLISSMTATGASPAQVSYTYNNNYFPTAMNLVSGADTVASFLTWDADGLVKGFGSFTFTRNGPKGAVGQISDAASSTAYNYDNLARIAGRNHSVNVLPAYATQISYDISGRVTGKTETVSGVTVTFAYTYDLNGQLTEVRRDGVLVERYTYDLNGNRTSRQLGTGPLESANYDSQDRLLQRGTVTYTFDTDGFLAQRGADTFQYSARGQLLSATVGAQPITYAYDGLGRRISRTDGSGTTRYLYGDPASHLVTAVRGTGGELTALIYNPTGLLIALDRGGARYYVATDQVGTPRVVSNAAGAAAKVIEYDSFGNLIADSNPGFDMPIGFAGGLADAASGLVHFGYRDYDPAAGRWTARDPVLFGAGQGNLYMYAKNNPIAYRDPTGLFCISATGYEGIGGGVGVCITSEGASVCGEVGFGVGVSVGVDVGGGLEKTGTQLLAEASYQVGIAKIGAGVSLDSGGCLSATGKGQIGPITAEVNDSGDLSKAGLDLDVEGAPKIGGGAEAKIAAKGCVQGKW